MVLHYAKLAAERGRRRCLPDRLGAARPHPRALGLRRLSGGDAARRARRRGEGDPRRRHDRHLRRRLDRIRRARGRCRRERGALSARSAVGVVRDRRRRHRLLRAALRLARRRRSSRPRARERDLRPRLSRRQSARAAKASTGTTPTTPRAPRRRARRSPTASASPGCSASRTSGTGGRTRITSASAAPSLPRRPRWVPQGKPIWLTELGCPAVDKGANQPSMFPDPKSSDGGVPYFSNGRRDDLIQRRYLEARARRVRSGVRRERDAQSGLVGLWRPHGRSDARSICGPGTRGPIRCFPPRSTCGATARTGRPGTGSPAGSAPRRSTRWSPPSSTDAGIDGLRQPRRSGEGAGRLCDRSADVAARGDRAARARLRVRCGRGRRRARVPAARRRAGRRTRRGRSRAAGATRAGAARARAGDRAAARGLARLHRRRRRLSPRGRDLAPPGRRRRAREPCRSRGRDQRRRGRAARRHLAAGSVGRARERRLRAAAEPARARAGRRRRLTVGGRRRLLELRERRRRRGPRASRRARSIPEVFDLPLAPPRRRAARRAGRGRAGACADCSICRRSTADEPPVLLRLAVFADPWPGRSRSGARATARRFERAALALAPAIVGETLDDLPRGPTSRFDHVNRVRVQLYGGALASVSDLALFGGANAAAVQRADGAWEVLQFANAEAGRRATPTNCRACCAARPAANGRWAIRCRRARRSCCSTSTWSPIARGLDALGRPCSCASSPPTATMAIRPRSRSTATPQATALRPLSPVHLRARARRRRRDVLLDPPHAARRRFLGRDRGAARRGRARPTSSTCSTARPSCARCRRRTPSVLYAAADEIADFGAAQTSLSVRVAQLSATVGRGFAADAVLDTREPSHDRHRQSRPALHRSGAGAEARHPQRGAAHPRHAGAACGARPRSDAPPGSPGEGERWIVKASPAPSGAWAGHGNQIAAWQDGGWQFSAPQDRLARLRRSTRARCSPGTAAPGSRRSTCSAARRCRT